MGRRGRRNGDVEDRNPVVDVRDIADLHVRAMVEPGAAGERFLATAGVMSLPEIANLPRVRLGPAARKVPTRTASDWARG
jgi:dihydroflavonol-4-reductase